MAPFAGNGLSFAKIISENILSKHRDFHFTFFTYTLAEMAEITVVKRGFMLEIHLAAEMLPVGILKPV
jgi:hypothetical protein